MRNDIKQLRKIKSDLNKVQVQADPLADNAPLTAAFGITVIALDLVEAIIAADESEKIHAIGLIKAALDKVA